MNIEQRKLRGLPASLKNKQAKLVRFLRRQQRVVIAYSGGVDSTFLAAVAREVLGDGALAVLATSPSFPDREVRSARVFARRLGLSLRVIASGEMRNPRFRRNRPDRCYHCKQDLFGRLRALADRGGYRAVLDGSNADDRGDYRPGRRAALEAGVLSPLMELGFTKEEIRVASRAMGLPTADKPSFACLASRLPYGTSITAKALQAVDCAENALLRMGFRQVRVRVHGDLARIEVGAEQITRALAPVLRRRIVREVGAAGFRYVALDLQGYRTGSMNAGLPRR